MNPVLKLLLHRRSVPVGLLAGPGPDQRELDLVLAAASRVPDHGKLMPWRFLIIAGEARARAGDVLVRAYAANNTDVTPSRINAERTRLEQAPLVVAVVYRGQSHPKIPEWEQTLSAGAVAMNLIIAANALGFATCWLTGWFAYDPSVMTAFGLEPPEKFVGFIHIGRAQTKVPDRPRPSLCDIVSWL